MINGQKWVKILIAPLFRLKFDDATVKLSLTVLSRTFFYKLTLILSYFMLKFVKFECHLHGGCHPPTPSLCLILEPRR